MNKKITLLLMVLSFSMSENLCMQSNNENTNIEQQETISYLDIINLWFTRWTNMIDKRGIEAREHQQRDFKKVFEVLASLMPKT